MMKAAFAHWDHRIAPVFDTARRIHVAETESGRIVAEREEVLADDMPVRKALRLAELGVGTLVCGAISTSLRAIVASYGILVIPFVAGDLSEVIQAWLGGCLEGGDFAMPGCWGRGRGRRGEICGMNQEGSIMNERGRGGMGPGGGQGRGRGGQGKGRMGGPLAAGAGGACLCPKCGHREPHELGVPCVQKQCPKCGTAMIRE
jgi:predicted Fe-Mo cluster-binding NifX family protein